MADQDPNELLAPAGPRSFATTHWSMVLAAARRSPADSSAALEELCAWERSAKDSQ